MTIGSLCSGACDGLSLGLEWAGLGPTLWQVELEDGRRANLARHWPHASRAVVDVRKASKRNLAPVDLVAISAPCQDLSSAGQRAGLSGPRSGLWYECERVVGELLPDFVVVENVGSGARNWVPHVRSGLERLGYSTLPIPIAASDLGAPHSRRRVFVLAVADAYWSRESLVPVHSEVAQTPEPLAAYDDGETRSQQQDQCPATDNDRRGVRTESRRSKRSRRRAEALALQPRKAAHEGWPTDLEVVPRIHGIPAKMVRWLGDSVVPQCAEVVGWVIRDLIDGKDIHEESA